MGLSQWEFANELKVGQATVSRWMNGVTPVPGYVEVWLKQRDENDELKQRTFEDGGFI